MLKSFNLLICWMLFHAVGANIFCKAYSKLNKYWWQISTNAGRPASYSFQYISNFVLLSFTLFSFHLFVFSSFSLFVCLSVLLSFCLSGFLSFCTVRSPQLKKLKKKIHFLIQFCIEKHVWQKILGNLLIKMCFRRAQKKGVKKSGYFTVRLTVSAYAPPP